jgi:hypothetical protein
MLSPKCLLSFCLSLGLLWGESNPSYAADGQTQRGGFYCLQSSGEKKTFAGKIRRDGNLSFGISIWNSHGNNIMVFGVALRRGRRWEYLRDMNEPLAEDRCKLTVVLGPDGVQVSADRSATCQKWGGYGTSIEEVYFPKTAYEGSVTTELSNPEVFFNSGGKCSRK